MKHLFGLSLQVEHYIPLNLQRRCAYTSCAVTLIIQTRLLSFWFPLSHKNPSSAVQDRLRSQEPNVHLGKSVQHTDLKRML